MGFKNILLLAGILYELRASGHSTIRRTAVRENRVFGIMEVPNSGPTEKHKNITALWFSPELAPAPIVQCAGISNNNKHNRAP